MRTAFFRAAAMMCLVLVAAGNAGAYSVLTHEQIVDMVWLDQIRPMLLVKRGFRHQEKAGRRKEVVANLEKLKAASLIQRSRRR